MEPPSHRGNEQTHGSDELTHVDAEGRLRMVDVGDKAVTSRRAMAEGRVRISAALAETIQAGKIAKGNLLEVARLAGIQAAKRTDELIPLAHSLPLEHVHVAAWLDGLSVRLRAEVRTSAKTGVEMEALVAVSVAALTVIDMGKAVDPAMVIDEVRLLEKTGGVRGDYHATMAITTPPSLPSRPIRVAVLTLSDRCARGETEDTSGPALCALARQRMGAEIVATACMPDDHAQIVAQLRCWALEDPRPDLVLTTGGTGLAPRDVTPEATAEVLQRRHPALIELARLRCSSQTVRTFLSRGEAGTLGQSLLINLPGSQRGATECFLALVDILPHAIETLRGEVRDDGRPEGPASAIEAVQP